MCILFNQDGGATNFKFCFAYIVSIFKVCIEFIFIPNSKNVNFSFLNFFYRGFFLKNFYFNIQQNMCNHKYNDIIKHMFIMGIYYEF